MWVAFAKANHMQKLLTVFQQKILAYMPLFNDQIFNDTLTNDIVSFEQLGPVFFLSFDSYPFCSNGYVQSQRRKSPLQKLRRVRVKLYYLYYI